MPPIAGSFQGGTGGMQSFQSLIPPMPSPNFVPSQNFLPGPAGQAGFMPPAIGGNWNQIAQQMAGPMYLPHAPPAGIPYPIRPPAPPAAAHPPVVSPTTTLPGLTGRAMPPGGSTGPLGGIGSLGGGSAGGMRGMGGNFQMFAPPMSIYEPVMGLDGSPNSAIPSPFGGSGGAPAGNVQWWNRPGTQVA